MFFRIFQSFFSNILSVSPLFAMYLLVEFLGNMQHKPNSNIIIILEEHGAYLSGYLHMQNLLQNPFCWSTRTSRQDTVFVCRFIASVKKAKVTYKTSQTIDVFIIFVLNISCLKIRLYRFLLDFTWTFVFMSAYLANKSNCICITVGIRLC